MSEFDNRGQVALWNGPAKGPKSPEYVGSVIAHRDIKEGETLDIALWGNSSSNPKAPAYKGKMSDKRETHAKQDATRQPHPDDPNDSIPF
jgi:hypothetical protein